MNFDKRPDLCVDVANMFIMLKSLKFEIVIHTDLEAEVSYFSNIE